MHDNTKLSALIKSRALAEAKKKQTEKETAQIIIKRKIVGRAFPRLRLVWEKKKDLMKVNDYNS